MIKYKVVSQEILDRKSIHSIVTHLFDKSGLERFKIKVIGPKILTIITKKDLPQALSYSFTNQYGSKINELKIFKLEKLVIPEKVSKITLQGEISYSKTITGKNQKIRPVSFYAKDKGFIENELVLKEFLLNQLGIKSVNIQVEPLGKIEISKHKIIYDAFIIKVSGEVINQEKTLKLWSESVGSAKSYGFGSLEILDYES